MQGRVAIGREGEKVRRRYQQGEEADWSRQENIGWEGVGIGRNSGTGGSTVIAPLACVVLVLCSRSAAVLLHSAAFSDRRSYCWSRVIAAIGRHGQRMSLNENLYPRYVPW